MNKLTWIFIFILLVSLFPIRIFAQCQQDACGSIPSDNAHLTERIACLENAGQACRNQRETLSSQINYMNNQIKLLMLRIENTKSIISKLSSEIDELGGEITRLEIVLTKRSELLLRRIPESYKRAAVPQFGLLLLSSDFSNFITRAKYLMKVQEQDANLLFQVKATQNNFTERKNFREEKKTQQEQAKKQLEQQNIQLIQQKQAKDALLVQTQGQETAYQQLLVQAKNQLLAFSGFVQGQGGVTLIDADPNWPNYFFSQRDKRWGAEPISGFYSSPSNITTIGESGCLISSVAMVLSKKGNSTTPFAIGTTGSYFFNAYFLWDGLRSLGFGTPVRTTNKSAVDNILSQGKWVIVGMNHTPCTSCDPFHFVVIKEKRDNDYILFDPWKGPNISFNNNYGSDYITEIISY